MKNERWPAMPAALLVLAMTAGCADDLPTAGGEDRFPGGVTPTTIEVLLTRDDIVVADSVYDGFADPIRTSYLIAAEDFDGALDAHVLARFPNLPGRVTYTADGTSRTDSVYTLVGAEVRAVVDTAATATVGGTATLRIWSLEQSWDSTAVTWEMAAPDTAWRVPGGTRGELLAEATWARGDTVAADTVVWQLDSLAISRVTAAGAHGLMVTSADPGSRVRLGRLSMTLMVRPESTPDTTVTAKVTGGGAQNFIFTPPPPQAAGVYRVGGITAARTVLRLDLGLRVPGCADPAAEPDCPTVLLDDVTINRAELVLTPMAVPSGFRPLRVSPMLVRRVVEPELGRLSPLGQALVSDTISAALFTGVDPAPVRLNLTTAVRTVVGTESRELDLALLGESVGGQFGYQWYVAEPVLRVMYTLPNIPRLP